MGTPARPAFRFPSTLLNIQEQFHDSPAYLKIWVEIDDDVRRAWYWYMQGRQSCPHCCIAEIKPIVDSYCTNLGCRGKVTKVEKCVSRVHGGFQ